ncbi:MAG: type III-B CRISPR module RAMP protein Cmr4 [Campylobacteraceae bacterium]|jgi:CRISPR-associated protein Cmr4|nr:type III-B CRISPR module RAMP protein Cmr4 [Campylobacteraceae bacterium]
MSYNISILVMYALTPCHAGSGSALGVVDLPIQRERHTNYPLIYSSGIKGAFRANFNRFERKLNDGVKFNKLTESIFGEKGSDGDGNKGGYAGAISVSDAKILAFPMRSSVAPFVWITCPTVLGRLNRDLKLAGKSEIVINTELSSDEEAIALNCDLRGDILIEDYQVNVKEGKIESDLFKQTKRLLLVSDKVFDYGVSHCTQINAQIAINQESGSTDIGSLRYQEELPSDTLMYCTVAWSGSRDDDNKLSADNVKKFIQDTISKYIQVGGDETLGRGIFELTWIGEKE